MNCCIRTKGLNAYLRDLNRHSIILCNTKKAIIFVTASITSGTALLAIGIFTIALLSQYGIVQGLSSKVIISLLCSSSAVLATEAILTFTTLIALAIIKRISNKQYERMADRMHAIDIDHSI